MIKKNLSKIKKVINGGQMEMTRSQLAEVRNLLDDVSKVGSPELKDYIKSVQKVLQGEKDIAAFGIKVEKKIAPAPRLNKGNLATTWANLKRTR